MVKAYSYIRFSSPQQREGDSLRRQIERTSAYCIEKGYTLDASTTFRDEGLSGYHGTHRTKGKLGAFLALVEAGQIKSGSALIVEAMDRLSRQTPREALSVFLSIINAGVELHTLMDGQVYSRKSLDANMGQLFLSIGLMFGANAESKNKSERVTAAWIKRRSSATNVVPAWIDKTADGLVVHSLMGAPAGVVTKLVVNKERADVIRRIFKLTASMGTPEIAKTLNREGAPPLRRNRWDGATIRRLVRGRQVLGEQEVHRMVDRKPVATGKVIKDAYPAIISEAEWRKAQTALDARAMPKGRNVQRIRNLFGDMARCHKCGARMVIKNGGRRRGDKFYEYNHLVCGGFRTGMCENGAKFDVRMVEAHMARVFASLVPQPVKTRGKAVDPAQQIKVRLSTSRNEAAKMQRSLDAMAERFADAPASIQASMLKLADGHRAKLAEVETLERELAVVASSSGDREAAATVWQGLHGVSGEAMVKARAHVLAYLPKVLERMTFNPDGTFRVSLKNDWHVLKSGKLTHAVRPEPWDKAPLRPAGKPLRKGEDPFAHAASLTVS